ncbi:MAG: hypothetical protein UW41_C0032G0003 [Candidatus Collierbacteria bacterium GW2011_GWC2_44_18]|uniref:Uncharacterized protein n=1 Tax=Candidatus Collierbacteria bacterium GW2011_GWC2_44_18 TaxID=1618392 RepID=A0A0G1HN46_9BACT|nr:MAG: hypothetical protein UW41_C0032G0003 [Candidatus Collierbacteria bacterium GW2011_GWC2_44_18]
MADPAIAKAQGYLARLVDFSNPTLGTSLTYKNISSQVELMCKVFLSLPGNGNPLAATDPEKALKDLMRWKVVNSVEDISSSVNAITDAFSTYLTGGRISFTQLVGADTIETSDIRAIFQTRRDSEVREQTKLSTQASDYKKMLTDSADKLGVPLVPAAPKPAPKPAKKPAFVVTWLLKDEVKAKGRSTVDSLVPSWQTPPILDIQSEDIDKLTSIWGWLFTDKHEADVVKNALLNSYNTDETKLAELFARILDVLDRQLEQCRTILNNIEKDFKLYNGCLVAALDLQGMLVKIGEFYGFAVGAKVQTPKSPKSR